MMAAQRTVDWDAMYRKGQRPPWQRDELNPAYEYWLHHQILKPCRILLRGQH